MHGRNSKECGKFRAIMQPIHCRDTLKRGPQRLGVSCRVQSADVTVCVSEQEMIHLAAFACIAMMSHRVIAAKAMRFSTRFLNVALSLSLPIPRKVLRGIMACACLSCFLVSFSIGLGIGFAARPARGSGELVAGGTSASGNLASVPVGGLCARCGASRAGACFCKPKPQTLTPKP